MFSLQLLIARGVGLKKFWCLGDLWVCLVMCLRGVFCFFGFVYRLGVDLGFVYAVIVWFLTYYVRTLVQIAVRFSTVKHKFFRDYVKWVKIF